MLNVLVYIKNALFFIIQMKEKIIDFFYYSIGLMLNNYFLAYNKYRTLARILINIKIRFLHSLRTIRHVLHCLNIYYTCPCILNHISDDFPDWFICNLRYGYGFVTDSCKTISDEFFLLLLINVLRKFPSSIKKYVYTYYK